MGELRQRSRITSKILQLPAQVKQQVDEMLLDTSITYREIAEHLQEEGYEISTSSIGRYAIRSSNALKKLMQAQEQTKALVEAIKKDPDADYTEGALRIMTNELTQKFVTAEEEWDEMPLDKAARVMVSLSRTKAYKDKLKQDMQSKIELAFSGMEKELMKAIKQEPDLSRQLKEILEKAKEKMMQDD